MTYTYGEPHDYHGTVFKQGPEAYPTLHLPVAHFVRPEVSACYQGASSLANFIIRKAMDHPRVISTVRESIPELLAEGDMGLSVHFDDGRIEVGLQNRGDTLLLTGGRRPQQASMQWRRLPHGSYEVVAVKKKDRALPLPEVQPPLRLGPRHYDTLPDHQAFLLDPALRFDAEFRDLEAELRGLLRTNTGQVNNFSVNS